MQTLHIQSLVLEPLVAAQAEAMFAVLRDPELYRFTDDSPPPSVEHLRQTYAARESRRSPDGRQRWLNWVIRERGHGLIGYVQATIEADGAAWIAFVLGRGSWGRGRATAATRCMMGHLAAAYGVRRFQATVEQANEKSIAVLRRLGFTAAAPEEAARHGLAATERLFTAGIDRPASEESPLSPR